VLWCPRQAAAQGERFHPFGVAVAQAAKDAVRDPTTYGPASLLYVSSRLDWDSSQPFFQHGAVEENPRYTVSGFGHDVPLSYAAGNRKLVTDALSVAAVSFVANTIEDVALRALIARQPEHRRLWKALGWIERTAVASSLGYTFSVRHFEQWQRNERRAGQLGY
jgi:hypothetical protein